MSDKLRLLYVASEIKPFLKVSQVADFVRKLPQAMQERGLEIRILVPRFGLINERKNRLHEVVRLSGINIAVGEEQKPLTIKVASIPNAKLQVYFIDNDDYFHRKAVFTDKEEKFFADNDERAVFFCKGVLETVKKLGWGPDIIHCNDWMTSLIPLYIKTAYKDDPLFENTKCVFSLYGNNFEHKFEESLVERARLSAIEDSVLADLENPDYSSFVKLGASYSDIILDANSELDADLKANLESEGKKIENTSMEASDELLDTYFEMYKGLAEK